jgi:hypothetical protein
MNIPRISLWTPEFHMPVRLAIRPFTDHRLDAQAQQIQADTQKPITITPGAMYILSSIAGRRIVEPIRWVLLDSLRDILIGNLRTEYPERQDLLAATYGEILGALLLALQLGDKVEIVRLLESNNSQTPDFLLLEPTSDGEVAHLLECKGVVADVHNINQRSALDVCQCIRSFRTSGKKQLDQIKMRTVKSGPRVVTRNFRHGLGKSVATKNLTVVYVPDARIPRLIDPRVQFPTYQRCAGQGADCIQCLTSSVDYRHSNIISVLHQERVASRTLNKGLMGFIRRYRSVQRALWSEDDDGFVSELNRLIEYLSTREPSSGVWGTTTLLTSTLFEAGVALALDVREAQMEYLREFSPPPIRDRIDWDLNRFQRWEGQERPELTRLSVERFFSRVGSGEIASQEKLLLDMPEHPHGIRGAAERYNANTIVRLTVNRPSAEAFETLKIRIENLIEQSSRRRDIDWHKEYVEQGGTRLDFGISWDKYPYPHPKRANLPGFTAWVAYDGRAELIIRRRTTP